MTETPTPPSDPSREAEIQKIAYAITLAAPPYAEKLLTSETREAGRRPDIKPADIVEAVRSGLGPVPGPQENFRGLQWRTKVDGLYAVTQRPDFSIEKLRRGAAYTTEVLGVISAAVREVQQVDSDDLTQPPTLKPPGDGPTGRGTGGGWRR
jgi:hypothetical protein